MLSYCKACDTFIIGNISFAIRYVLPAVTAGVNWSDAGRHCSQLAKDLVS